MMNTSPLKWVGGKHKILKSITPYINEPTTFVEPFVGSATVSLNVSANNYVLNDLNPDLINFYRHIIKDDDRYITACEPYFKDVTEKMYYELRDEFNSLSSTDFKRAVLFLFLNKFAFNGVCRYNNKGFFNVPFSKKEKVSFPMGNIKKFVYYFSNRKITLYNTTFDNMILFQDLKARDTVYFDPPYLKSADFKTGFTKYVKEGFSFEEHMKIKNLSVKLRENGVNCLISNHDTEETRELYKEADSIISIPISRNIAAKKESRKQIKELLVIYGKTLRLHYD